MLFSVETRLFTDPMLFFACGITLSFPATTISNGSSLTLENPPTCSGEKHVHEQAASDKVSRNVRQQQLKIAGIACNVMISYCVKSERFG